MADASRLTALFKECIPIFVALGDETRLTIIHRLYEARLMKQDRPVPGLNVKEITEQTSLSRPAVSHHLKILKDSGIVDVLNKGVCNYYYLTFNDTGDKLFRLGHELKKN